MKARATTSRCVFYCRRSLTHLRLHRTTEFQKTAQGIHRARFAGFYRRCNGEPGDHRFDGQVTDYSAEARAKELATGKKSFAKDSEQSSDVSKFTGANKIDFRILKDNIDTKFPGSKS